MDHVRRVVLGLGSNLGDRIANLSDAVRRLRSERDLRVLRQAAVYESPPLGGLAQDDYLNTAVLLVTSLEARAIFERSLAIEDAMGRVRDPKEKWAARVIDIDLLWIEGEAVHDSDLTVPHPGLRDRVFALRPLLDLAPDASDFEKGDRFADLPAALAPITRVAEAPPPPPSRPK